MIIELELNTEPKALQRAKTTVRHNFVSTYYTKEAKEQMATLEYSLINALSEEDKVNILQAHKNAVNGLKIALKVIFYMQTPSSYSKVRKKRLENTPHIKRPDLDNLIKNVLDRGNGILWQDDNLVYKIEAEKLYSVKPRIQLQIKYIVI